MPEESWQYVGVDWDSGGWIAVGYPESGEPEAASFESIAEFWEEYGTDAVRTVVDVPIGLCGSREEPNRNANDDELSRECDDLARTVIGPRSSSVFTAPCKAAAKAAANGKSYDDVNQTNRDHTGKGLMQQAANISTGIREVEELILEKGVEDRLLEGHPEVCFRAFADDDLEFNKKTAPGMAERLQALKDATEYDEGTWLELAKSLGDEGETTGTDDLLDALALALTAKADEDEFQKLPEDPPEDVEGHPMQMVYRRPNTFDVS